MARRLPRSALRRARRSRVQSQGRSGMLLDVDVEFGTEIGVDFEKIRRLTDDFVVHEVKRNAERGQKPNGRKYRRYSRKYQADLRRVGEGTQVDLTRTGAMLASFHLYRARTRRVSRTHYEGAELGVARRVKSKGAQLIMQFQPRSEYFRQAIGLAAIGYKWVGLGKQAMRTLAAIWGRAGITVKKRSTTKRRRKIGPLRPSGKF